MKGTWQTTDSGSGALGELAVIILGAAAVAAVAVPLIRAVTSLLVALAVIVAALAVLGSVGLVLLLHLQRRQRRANPGPAVTMAHPVHAKAAGALPAPQPRAIERAAEVHLHFHGVTAEDAAAIVGEVNHRRG